MKASEARLASLLAKAEEYTNYILIRQMEAKRQAAKPRGSKRKQMGS